MNFTWDPAKAKSNLAKHGVSFEEAGTVFEDPFAVVRRDEVHSDRDIIVGMSAKLRILLCVYLEIGEQEVRIVSARRTTRRETKDYEEGHP